MPKEKRALALDLENSGEFSGLTLLQILDNQMSTRLYVHSLCIYYLKQVKRTSDPQLTFN